ncbi:putative uncharacterized protein DDB_G0282133 [Hydra vulgaris]|uniref:putative uncharacterized protein DDB_G0282133 n=1 Tax=Hydra vulgaris TaxID=6087 RepID=UPI001F5EEB77|nr:putative uncharacterized protein DDB_G0282133 [Hydra vulgaris]
MKRAVDTIKTSMMRQGRRSASVGPFTNHQILTEKITTFKQNSFNINADNFYQSSPSSQHSSESYKSSLHSPSLNEPQVFFNTDKKKNIFETPNSLLFTNNNIKNYNCDEKSAFLNSGIASDIKHTLHAPSYNYEKQILDNSNISTINESLHNKAFLPFNNSDNPMLNKSDVLSENFRFQDQIKNDYKKMRQKNAIDTIKTSMKRQGQRNVPLNPFQNYQIITEKTTTIKQNSSNINADNSYQSSPSSQQSSLSYKSSALPYPPLNEAEVFFNTEKKQNIFETPTNMLFSNNYIKNYYRDEKSNFFNPSTLRAPANDNEKQFLDYSNTSAINESLHNKTFCPVNNSDSYMLNKKDDLSEQFRFQDQNINDCNEMCQKNAIDTIEARIMRQGRSNVSVDPFQNHQILTEKTTTLKKNSSNTNADNFYQTSLSSQQSFEFYKSSSPNPPLNAPEVFFNTDKRQNIFETPTSLLFSNNNIKTNYSEEKCTFYNAGIASDIFHSLHPPSYDYKKLLLDYSKTSTINESFHNKAFRPVNNSDNRILNRKDVFSEELRFQEQIMNDYNKMRQKNAVDTIKTIIMHQGRKNVSVGTLQNHQILTEKTNTFKQNISNINADNFYQSSPSSQQSFESYKSSSPYPPLKPEVFFNTVKKQNIFETPNSLLCSKNYIKTNYCEEKSTFFNLENASDINHTLHAPSYDYEKLLLVPQLLMKVSQ